MEGAGEVEVEVVCGGYARRRRPLAGAESVLRGDVDELGVEGCDGYARGQALRVARKLVRRAAWVR
ncbi:hypothetical protein DMH04_37790 [Kibdelosporangium aridum]|uniref:Uncharacterized protein n=1 Tax=Kibdelosporangium aridum TaxID=2030 RepID=A0A428YYH7_KIBAR|nr:hypothetical protein DMH04_37790 [Kibdelosporangium aridum]